MRDSRYGHHEFRNKTCVMSWMYPFEIVFEWNLSDLCLMAKQNIKFGTLQKSSCNFLAFTNASILSDPELQIKEPSEAIGQCCVAFRR